MCPKGEEPVVTTAAKPDRRAERTRALLLAAFNELVLARGYDALTVRDIIEHANVGRSTFYEHFENKDDILRRSLRPVFGVLADAVGTAKPHGDLEEILAHFRENSRLTRTLLQSSTHFLMSQILAELIEERLCAPPVSSRDAKPSIPLSSIAAHLAGAQLALIESWLSSEAPCSCEVLARALRASASASLRALSGTAI
jgi:AcrR family transcriptional regulator